MRTIVLLVSLSVLLSGCATMRYPTVYKVEGKEVKEFKELDDDQAVKAIVLVYNVKHDDWEGGIARSIALEEYLGLAKKRNSRYIKNSGVFDLKYDRVDISSWEDDDLRKLYAGLLPRARGFYMDSAAELTEIQNADRILYLTAINIVAKEMRKRKNADDATAIAGRILVGVLSVALSMI